MIWHDIRDPHSAELDQLAARYGLHPLHVEDCRHGGQRAKVEDGSDYLFIVLKPACLDQKKCELEVGDFDIFLGRDFLITVLEDDAPRQWLDRLNQVRGNNQSRPDQLMYRLFDSLVDSYVPTLDSFADVIDRIEDGVVEAPSPDMLQWIYDTKRNLVEMRRLLGNTRDVAGHLQRADTPLIQRDLWPFIRDIYDHIARNLDTVEMQRDLLASAMDIYLSSVTQRTNETMKVLTILGTIALPAVVITGFFGMNLHGLPLTNHPLGAELIFLIMVLSMAALLYMLRRFGWW